VADVGDGLRRLSSPLRRIFNSVHAMRTHRKQRTKDGANKSFIARRAALVDTDRAVGAPRRDARASPALDTTPRHTHSHLIQYRRRAAVLVNPSARHATATSRTPLCVETILNS